MEPDNVEPLRSQIQKGIADLNAGRVRSGKQVIDDLVVAITTGKTPAKIQEHNPPLLEK